jgi:PTH1 family peptidyl-tRNA hydrolase
MTEKTFLLIGLGNPGREFRDNRHNAGFMVIDRLAVRLNARGMKLQSKAIVTSTLYDDKKLILAKPQTYMNLSGHSVQGLANFYKVPLENLMVMYDDLDLPFGTIRLRPGGGPGGQKGVASAIDRLGTKDFARLRIGIGRPPGRMDAADYVLQNFSWDEIKTLSEILDHASDAVLSFILEGIDKTMSKFNGEITVE